MQFRGRMNGLWLGSLLALLGAAGCSSLPAVKPPDSIAHPAVASREFHTNDSVEIQADEPAMDAGRIEPGDLLDRIREGFLLADSIHPSVYQEVACYASHHAEEGKLLARFETLYLTGWAPHESQQVPLKPGSAKARLADALGTDEHGLKGQ